MIARVSTFLVIILFLSAGVFSLANAQTATTSATSTPDITVESILKNLYGTSNPDILDYERTLQIQTDADLPQLPAQFKEVPIIVDLTPEVPGPEENVAVKLESYSTDLNRDQITWVLNGKIVQKGIGLKNYSFRTGKIGSSSALTVIISVNGLDTVKKVTIGPGAVDLIWQASTYTPPFYQGKALFSHQAKIKIVALPNLVNKSGVKIPAASLIYKWKNDGTVMDAFSGYGKNSFTLEDSIPVDSTPITVEVSSLDGTIKGMGSAAIRSISPQVILYRDNPLTGVTYETAVSSPLTLKEKEVKLVVEPYFFSTKNKLSDVSYFWSLNSNQIVGKQVNSMIFRGEDGKSGNSLVSIQVKQLKKMFQFNSDDLQISF